MESLRALCPALSEEQLHNILSFANTLKSEEATTTLGLPDFPLDLVPHVARILVSTLAQ